MNSLEKWQLIEYLQQKRKAKLEESFYEFVKDAFEVLHPGETISDNWHIKYICELLQAEIERIISGCKKTKDIIINVPPRSLKSFITSVCLPAWAWVKDSRLKFIGSSYSSDLSIEHNVATRRLVESEWYQQYWQDKVSIAFDQNQKSKFETTQNGLRRATSTGGTITGSGADVIIIDDPVNPQLAASEVERKTANKHFDETLSTRLNHPDIGLFLIIMQRLHEEDLTGYLVKKNPQSYEHICIPAEISSDVKPSSLVEYYTDSLFFPNRFTKQVLAKLKTSLGSYGYAGQYSQRPSPEEGGTLKKKWFKQISYEAYKKIVGSISINYFLDTAYTEKQTNDPTALFACCYHQNNLYILNSSQVWKELPELLKYIPEYVAKYSYTRQSRILIEPKASGKSIAQSFKNTAYNVIELPPPLDSKLVRVNNISPFVEAGRCFIVDGSWNDGFLNECAAFPNGLHDDQVDNLANAIDYYTAANTGMIKTRTKGFSVEGLRESEERYVNQFLS